MEKIISFLLNGSDNVANNVVKALLIGFIVGLFFFLWGKDFDFAKPYGVIQGLASGIIVAGALFLKYNNKK